MCWALLRQLLQLQMCWQSLGEEVPASGNGACLASGAV